MDDDIFAHRCQETIHDLRIIVSDPVRRGALLHDIGKLGIPDRILLKQGPLDEEETKIMQGYPVIGFELLKKIEVSKMLEDREAAARRALADQWQALWHKILPNIVTGLIILGPLALAVVIAVLVFVLRALGIDVNLPT